MRIEFVLAYREVDTASIPEKQHQRGTSEYNKYIKCDKMPCAITGLSLSDDMLEHVREYETAISMLEI